MRRIKLTEASTIRWQVTDNPTEDYSVYTLPTLPYLYAYTRYEGDDLKIVIRTMTDLSMPSSASFVDSITLDLSPYRYRSNRVIKALQDPIVYSHPQLRIHTIIVPYIEGYAPLDDISQIYFQGFAVRSLGWQDYFPVSAYTDTWHYYIWDYYDEENNSIGIINYWFDCMITGYYGLGTQYATPMVIGGISKDNFPILSFMGYDTGTTQNNIFFFEFNEGATPDIIEQSIHSGTNFPNMPTHMDCSSIFYRIRFSTYGQYATLYLRDADNYHYWIWIHPYFHTGDVSNFAYEIDLSTQGSIKSVFAADNVLLALREEGGQRIVAEYSLNTTDLVNTPPMRTYPLGDRMEV